MNKLLWHQTNLNFLKRRGYRNGCLQGSYLEVVDDTTPQSYALLVADKATRCLRPHGFLAVNNRPEAILGHPRNPPYRLFCEDAFDLALRLSRTPPERLAAHGIAGPVLAFNFDMQSNADASGNFWAHHSEQLLEIALNTYKAHGLCKIILNMSLHPRFLHERALLPSEAAAQHAQKVCDTFRDLQMKGLTRSTLVGDTPSVLDGDLDLRGRESGACQIYRRTSVPMLTVRLMFSDGVALCGFADPFARAA